MSGIFESLNHASAAAIAAVLNSLWQTAAVAAAAWAAMRFTPRMNAATRHALWWTVLAAILIVPAAPVFIARWQALPEPARLALRGEPVDVSPSISVTHATDADHSADRPAATPHSAPAAGPLELRTGTWPAWIAVVWSAVLLMQLGRIAWSYGYLRQVKRRAHRASPELRRSFDAWMMSCGVHRTTVLLVSKEIGSPMAVGFRQPAVILPAALLEHFHEPELDHVLLHELAHIARQDDWTNLGARLASSLLALHPVAAWVLRQIEREREMACDDWVVSMTGEARPYAASLARLFEVCFTRRRMMLASGMAQRSSHLGERIQTLLHRRGEYPSKASISRVVLSSAVLLALAIAGTQAPQWLVLAQDAPVASMQEQTPPPAPAAQPAPTAPRAPEAPQAPASTPSPEAAPEAPQAPVPALASTPPLSGRADTLAIEQELDRLQAVRAGLAKTYGPRHPELERIRAQIATLENVINSSPAPAPQPGRASTPPARGSFLAALVAAGYGNLSVDEIINLKSAGVTTQFLEGINQAGWGKLSAQELIDLSQHGVNPEYIRKMKAAGIRDLTLKDIMELAMFGVRPETMQEIHGLGFGPYTAKEAIQFAQYGLRIDLFRALKDSGLGNATPNEIVEAYTVGLNARDLREARQYGSNLTLKQIVKLKMAGVF